MSRIPKPKTPSTQENLKIEDMMKNGTSIEDLLVKKYKFNFFKFQRKANFTMEEIENIKKGMESNNTETNSNQTNTNSTEDKKNDL